MKKTILMFFGIAAVFLASCATGGAAPENNGTASTNSGVAAENIAPIYEGDGISLHEAIEQSAGKICADLPSGSRVAFAAWESSSLGLSDYIMEELTGALVDRGMEVADRQNLEYVKKELSLQISGDVSDESARSIGKFLGADTVITGQLTELGGPYRYRASAITVESAVRSSVTRLSVRGDAELRRMVTALATQKTVVKVSSYGESGKAAPGTAGAFLDRGITLASQKEFALAIEDFSDAIRLNPNLSSAYQLRGRAYVASVSYVTSVGENFDFVNIISSFGETNSNIPAQQQAYDKALADFTQALRLDPNFAKVYIERGAIYSSRRDYDRAIADYNQAIRLDPNSARTYTYRGNVYFNKGDYDRAIADYNQTIRLDPNSAHAYLNRGNVYSDKGDYDRAIADYTQAIRLDPDPAAAYTNRGVAYFDKGDYARAIADYNQAILIDPNFAGPYTSRGNLYLTKGDYDRAIADYNRGIRLDPNNVSAYTNRGNAYFDKGDIEKAIADFTQAIRLDPNYTKAYYNRGNAYLDKEDIEKAIADFTQTIRLDPNFVSAYTNRAIGYYIKGDYTKVRADLNRVLQLDPNNANARNNLNTLGDRGR